MPHGSRTAREATRQAKQNMAKRSAPQTAQSSETRYWMAVASREHVKRGEAAGICQACHGKRGPLQRMKPGDWIIYYSSVEQFQGKEPCQKFTAIGTITGESTYQVRMSDDFIPFRRDVAFQQCAETPIKPFIEQLTFIRNKKQWGYMFRFGFFEIPEHDFALIADRMLGASPNLSTKTRTAASL
jgi:predicted RNA-binding protein